jgi:ElaB/YqjD/DUF883 family membrane-anchored ribosome-binding protein
MRAEFVRGVCSGAMRRLLHGESVEDFSIGARNESTDVHRNICGIGTFAARSRCPMHRGSFFKGSVPMTDTSRSDFNQAGSKAQDSVDRIADKAKGAIDSASAVASQTISKVEDAGKQAWDIGQKFGTQAKDQAQDVADQVSEQTSRALSAVTRQVQAEPLLGILVAGAIGYFLAVLSRR